MGRLRANCEGISRRDSLTLGLGGLISGGLVGALRASDAHGGEQSALESIRKQADACILIWMDGGPSHYETFDPKPEAPVEIRGQFRAIATQTPGIHFSQPMKRLAAISDDLAIVRSIRHDQGNHGAGNHYMMTGAPPRIPVGCGAFVSFHPSLGSVVAHQVGAPHGIPAYFSIPSMSRSGGPNFLGAKYAPFVVPDDPNRSSFRVRDVTLPSGLTDVRFQSRQQIRGQIDKMLRITEASAGDPAMASDEFFAQGLQLISSPEAQAAFDIHSESDAMRDAYGRHSFGQRALLARRLVSAGVPFVTLYHGGWDHHTNLFKSFDSKMPPFESAIAALVEDLKNQGMLQRTLVIALGEFGRTPKINKDGGRDHWSNAMSVMFAGGGTPGGQVIGATDRQGYAAIERVLSPENFVSTVYRKLGIDPDQMLYTPEGRPSHLVSDATAISELMDDVLNGLTRLSLCAIAITCVPGKDAAAQVELERFFPPAVDTGGESVIQAEGKFPSWPVQVVCDRDDVKVEVAEESGKLRVMTTPDTTPGPAWIRMHDSTSASKLVPLLLVRGKVVAEVEPNNRVAEATENTLPAVFVGRLEKSGDVDTYRVSARGGQTMVVSATAHRVLRSPMDSVLQLLDERGGVLRQSDDAQGLDPRIIYEVPGDTELLIRIFAFPETPNSTIGFSGSKEFVYVLNVTSDAYFDHDLPLIGPASDPGEEIPWGWNLPAKVQLTRCGPTTVSPTVVFAADAMGWQWRPPTATSASSFFDSSGGDDVQVVRALPLVFSGHIDRPGEVDSVRFRAVKGAKYRATVHSREFGFALDSVLRLTDVSTSAELARNDDRSRNEFDATLEFTAKADGDVELQLSDLLDGFGPRHAYSVVIEQVSPTVELTLSADRFAVKAGESIEVPIEISRKDGFANRLSVTAAGLPAGVRAEAVVSEPKGDSAKSVKLKLIADATASYQGTFRVIAHEMDDQGNMGDKTFAATHNLRHEVAVSAVWLTAMPAK